MALIQLVQMERNHVSGLLWLDRTKSDTFRSSVAPSREMNETYYKTEVGFHRHS